MPGVAEVQFSREALRDRRRIPSKFVTQIAHRLEMLAAGRSENLDIKPLEGLKPWFRLRVGEYRVVYRETEGAIQVARIISRQELNMAIDRLRR